MDEQHQEMASASQSSTTEAPADKDKEGIVYILENKAFEVEVVKIGRTKDLHKRISTLNTGVPLPFSCHKASRVKDMNKAEKFLHQTFHPARKHWCGEFFEVEAWRVAEVLKFFEEEDVTDSAPAIEDKERVAINSATKEKERTEKFNFEMVKIPIGAELKFVDDEKKCTVKSQKPPKVEFEGEELSLSAAAQKAKKLDYSVQGSQYWKYKDPQTEEEESLQERRKRFESLSADADN